MIFKLYVLFSMIQIFTENTVSLRQIVCVSIQVVCKLVFYFIFITNKHTENHKARIILYIFLMTDFSADVSCTVEDIKSDRTELM